MGFSYRPDRRATGRFMKGAQMKALMKQTAEEGAALARQDAPRRTGEYAASFTTSVGVEEGRATGRVANTSDHAVMVELRHRVLARMVDRLKRGA